MSPMLVKLCWVLSVVVVLVGLAPRLVAVSYTHLTLPTKA